MTLVEAKAGFFDRAKVLNAVDSATRKVLSKFGAYVRTRAKSSIRQRKKVSQPGHPPSSHTGDLKRFIFFSYDPAKRSVVIGPTLLNRSDGGSIPATLEHGRGKYAARPYMGPAFNHEQAKLPELWRNALHK